MGTVHAVGKYTGKRFDDDQTGGLGLAAAGGSGPWWCVEGVGDTHFVAPSTVLYSVSEGVIG